MISINEDLGILCNNCSVSIGRIVSFHSLRSIQAPSIVTTAAFSFLLFNKVCTNENL